MALLQGILDEMEGVLPNDVGAVASYDGSRVRSDAAIKANSLKMSSYNRLGQKVKQWTIYGLEGAPATQASFTYNVSGELSATETAERKGKSWSTISSLAYYYDDMGRLKSVLESGDSLMRIDRTEAGTVSKKAYFDKGVHVYDMTYAKDVYGRTTRVSYRDASGKILYSDTVTYPSVVAGRLATSQHVWDGFSSDESYTYDAQGRLTGYTTDNANIGSGAYGYDGLGRLLSKREGRAGNDTLISYTYSNTLFRPLEMSVNGGMDTAYYVYDPSGNVWIDNNSRTTYTVNALGLPGKVRLFSDVPVVTFEQVNSMDNLGDEIAHTDMAYDEGGQRIWTQFVANAPLYRTEVMYPGIGEYTYSGHYSSDSLKLTRVDLLGGGYRTGVNGEALFPVKDLQGSVRGFANKTGLKSAFGYRPYGTTVNLVHYASDSDERWQSKEFDSEHGKYYFGARYYDPFFGMWISPDPAGQFANPYSYGGDPLNYIDPTGMWALGLGLVVGYDESHGWSFGVGAAVEIGDYGLNASFSFNQDGSKSLSSGANLKVPIQTPWVYLEINVGLGFTLNSYSGSSISAHGGVCVGEAGSCVGVDQGGSLYWDRSGGFAGMTVYAELYAQFAGDVRISTGYEAGLFGAEGRGAYAGASAYGLHAEVSQNGGFSWGFQRKFDMVKWTQYPLGAAKFSVLGFNMYTKGAEGIILGVDGLVSNVADEIISLASDIEDSNPGEYSALGHGSPTGIGDGILHEGGDIMSADQFAAALKNERFKYKGQKIIRLYSCRTGGQTMDGSPNFASRLADLMEATVIAPTTYVRFPKKVNKPVLYSGKYENGEFIPNKPQGMWVKCLPGKGCEPYLNAYGFPIH